MSDSKSSKGANLAAVIRDLPGPAVLGLGGAALTGLGLYWLFAVSWWWIPLKILAFPALGLGLGGLSVAALRAQHAKAIEGYRPPALEDESAAAGRTVMTALEAAEQPLTVDALAARTGLSADDAVLGLGHLHRAGRLDEILDERDGTFGYVLLDEAGDNDPDSHISLGQRLAAVEKARGGRR